MIRATPDEVKTSRATLDGLARQAGRAPSSLSITVFGQPADRDLVRRCRDAGADRVIVWLEILTVNAPLFLSSSRIKCTTS